VAWRIVSDIRVVHANRVLSVLSACFRRLLNLTIVEAPFVTAPGCTAGIIHSKSGKSRTGSLGVRLERSRRSGSTRRKKAPAVALTQFDEDELMEGGRHVRCEWST